MKLTIIVAALATIATALPVRNTNNESQKLDASIDDVQERQLVTGPAGEDPEEGCSTCSWSILCLLCPKPPTHVNTNIEKPDAAIDELPEMSRDSFTVGPQEEDPADWTGAGQEEVDEMPEMSRFKVTRAPQEYDPDCPWAFLCE